MKGKKFLVITFVFVFVLLWIAASPGFAVHLKTNKGPALYDTPTYLKVFFKGHNNYHIWEATYNKGRRSWEGPERITDGSGNWALTAAEPGVGKYVRNKPLNLVYWGHNNPRVWSTYKWEGRWSTPESVTRATCHHAPAVTGHPEFFPSDGWVYLHRKIYYKGQTSEYIYTRWTRSYRDTSWSRGQLPRTVKTSIGPCAIPGNLGPIVLYRGVGRDNRIYVYYEGNISSLPRAFTNKTPAAVGYVAAATSVEEAGFLYILVAYVGHNNNYIWLRRGKLYHDTERGVEWQRLGYIRGVATTERPALSKYGRTLYLAFKPIGSTEISVGTLEVDYENRPDTAGHRWTSIR